VNERQFLPEATQKNGIVNRSTRKNKKRSIEDAFKIVNAFAKDNNASSTELVIMQQVISACI
jgi:hypothetical protein